MELNEIMQEVPSGAIRPCGKGLYIVMVRTAFGDISAELLNSLNKIVQDLGLSGMRVTAQQRMQLINVPEDKLKEVVDRLGQVVGDISKYPVGACAGIKLCRFGVQDSTAMAEKLEEFLNAFELPSKLKSGVSGCSMSCGESYVRDVGLVGTKKGWTVLFGGNAGKGARKADTLAEGVSDEQAFEIIGKALDFYRENAKKKERTARFVERVGIDAVMEAVNRS